MRQVKTSIDIACSPGEAWRVLMEFPAYAEWNPYIQQIDGVAQPEPIEYAAGIGADLQPGAKLLNRWAAFEHHHRRAKLGQRKRQGHARNAGTCNDIIAARTGHGPAQAAWALKIAEAGLA